MFSFTYSYGERGTTLNIYKQLIDLLLHILFPQPPFPRSLLLKYISMRGDYIYIYIYLGMSLLHDPFFLLPFPKKKKKKPSNSIRTLTGCSGLVDWPDMQYSVQT